MPSGHEAGARLLLPPVACPACSGMHVNAHAINSPDTKKKPIYGWLARLHVCLEYAVTAW